MIDYIGEIRRSPLAGCSRPEGCWIEARGAGMLTGEALDRAVDPIGWGGHDPVRGAGCGPLDIEGVLRGLARYRTGQDAIDVAFETQELARLRRFLGAASQARGHVVQSRRRRVQRLCAIDGQGISRTR